MINKDLFLRCVQRGMIVARSYKECVCDIGIFETYINFDGDDITLNCRNCDKELDRDNYYEVIYGI